MVYNVSFVNVPHDSSILQLSGQKKNEWTELTKHLPLVFTFFFFVIFLTSLVKITAQPKKKKVNFLMGSFLPERTSRYDKILKVRIIHSIDIFKSIR